MHIPDALLQGKICPVTAIISAACIVVGMLAFARKRETAEPKRFAAIATLIFVAQMMNFPVMNGVSGHLVGSVLAARLLGWPLGMLAMSLVIVIQCLLFGDGGITVLGANILNMAIIGTLAGEGIYVFIGSCMPRRKWAALAAACWTSVMASAFAASLELMVSGGPDIIAPMLGVHALIGLGEALITCAAVALLASMRKAAAPVALAFLAALFASLANADPDGLEWIAQRSGIWNELSPQLCLMGIAVPQITAIIGGIASFITAYFLLRGLQIVNICKRSSKRQRQRLKLILKN